MLDDDDDDDDDTKIDENLNKINLELHGKTNYLKMH